MNLDYTHFPAIPDLLPILVIPPHTPKKKKRKKEKKFNLCFPTEA